MLVIVASVAALLLLADQASKTHIVNNYAPNEYIAGNPYLSLVFVINTGGICGYAQGANTLLTVVGFLTITFILVSILAFMPHSWTYAIAFGSLLAGASGNLIDRLRFGYVVDFITLDLLHWPSFNIADSSIVGGIALIGFLTVWEMVQEKKQEPVTDGDSAHLLQVGFGQSTVIFLIVAGLLFVLAYLFCVYRPFG
jgi:signal peptidase II